jgi:hypothetical protein
MTNFRRVACAYVEENSYDNNPLHIIELFDKYLSAYFNDRMIFEIYRMPLTIELYLASTEGSDEERSRYYLFRKESAGLIELGRSRGLEDDIRITRITFFIGKDRVLVMAETGVPPDFGGLEVFEFKNNRLRYLGPLTVAKKIKPAGLHGDYISPLEDATVEYKTNAYYLTMKGHLYSDWSYGSPEKKVATPDSTVTYYFDGKKFRMLPKKR